MDWRRDLEVASRYDRGCTGPACGGNAIGRIVIWPTSERFGDAWDGRPHAGDFRVRFADGVTRHVLTRSRFLCNPLGEPIGGHGIVVDITCFRAVGHDCDPDRSTADCAASPSDRAAEAAIAAYRAICVTHDLEFRACVEAHLCQIWRRLAAQEEWRNRMN